MYTLGLEIHYVSVVLLLAVVMFNAIMLFLSHQIIRYAFRMRVVMPISASLIALILFTGTIMMAAKHLSFTIANSAMILVGIMIIIVEAKRYKTLKRRTDITDENAFSGYKQKAYRMLGLEFLLIVFLMVWMAL